MMRRWRRLWLVVRVVRWPSRGGDFGGAEFGHFFYGPVHFVGGAEALADVDGWEGVGFGGEGRGGVSVWSWIWLFFVVWMRAL